MSAPRTQPHASFLKSLAGAVRGSIDSLHTPGSGWRKPLIWAHSPLGNVDQKLVPSALAVKMPKRLRERDVIDEGSRSATAGPLNVTQVEAKVLQENNQGMQLTPNIIEEMQKLALYRRKLKILSERKPKWERLIRTQEQKITRLERELKELAGSEERQIEAIAEIEQQLQRSKSAYEELAKKVYLLGKRIEVFKLNASFARDRLEDGLGLLLSGRGYFDVAVADTESSNQSSTRSSKKPRTEAGAAAKPSSPDPEAERKRSAFTRLHETQNRYREAEYNFENRSEPYRDALECNRQTEVGECSMTRTDFDVEYCVRYGDLGIDLAEAEANRSKAALEAMNLKARSITYSQTSKFVDDPADAEGLAKEAEQAIGALDASKIQAWLQTLQNDESAEQQVQAQVDDWEAQSLQYGESCNGSLSDGQNVG